MTTRTSHAIASSTIHGPKRGVADPRLPQEPSAARGSKTERTFAVNVSLVFSAKSTAGEM